MKQTDGTGQHHQEPGSIKELHDFLKEFDTAMLVTLSGNQLRARPMAIQNPDELSDCDLWFVTGDDTPKVDEIDKEHQVCACAYRARDRAYISISALARVDKDRAAIHRLYKPSWKSWFTGGPDDPTITLLKLTVERAEYWRPKAASRASSTSGSRRR